MKPVFTSATLQSLSSQGLLSLPPEIRLQTVAGHLDNLSDVVALAATLKPGIRGDVHASIWASDTYHALRANTAVRPEAFGVAMALADYRSSIVDLSSKTNWSQVLRAHTISTKLSATEVQLAKLVCPSHPLFAENADRDATIRGQLSYLSHLRMQHSEALREAPSAIDKDYFRSQLAVWKDQAFHALAVARVFLPKAAEEPTVRKLCDSLAVDVGNTNDPRRTQLFEELLAFARGHQKETESRTQD